MRKILAWLCIVLLIGSAQASVALRMDDGAELADTDGSVLIGFGTYDDIVPLNEELFAALQDGLYVLMDREGKVLNDNPFEYLKIDHGLLMGRVNGLWCLLDQNGSLLSEAAYDLIVPNDVSGAWAVRGTNGDVEADELLLLDANGAEQATGLFVRHIADTAGDGLIAVLLSDENLYAYCDTAGRIAFDLRTETAGCFANGLAAASVDGHMGIINAQGAWIIPPEYAFVQASSAGFILAAGEECVSVFDSDGNQLKAFEESGLSAAVVAESYMLAGNGEIQLFTGEQAYELPANAGVYAGMDDQLIVSEGTWGENCVYLLGTEKRYQNLIPLGRADGQAVYASMQANVVRYMNNLLNEIQLSVDMNSARYGIVNAEGEELLPPVYCSLEYLCDDRFLVRTERQWRMIDTLGRIYWCRNLPSAMPE